MPDAKWYAEWIRMTPAQTPEEKMRNLEAAEMMEHLIKENKAYKNVISAPSTRWISVKDRLPEKPGPYLCWLCFCELPIAMTIRYLGDGKWTMPESTISHWTDNPEPPKMEGK